MKTVRTIDKKWKESCTIRTRKQARNAINFVQGLKKAPSRSFFKSLDVVLVNRLLFVPFGVFPL